MVPSSSTRIFSSMTVQVAAWPLLSLAACSALRPPVSFQVPSALRLRSV